MGDHDGVTSAAGSGPGGESSASESYVRAYPAFRPLWNDPRFQALVGDSALVTASE